MHLSNNYSHYKCSGYSYHNDSLFNVIIFFAPNAVSIFRGIAACFHLKEIPCLLLT